MWGKSARNQTILEAPKMTTTTTKKDIEATIAGDGTLTLEFRHGETLTLHPEALNPEIQRAALLHGLKQKLVDAAAISRDITTGRAATIQTKFNAVKEIFDRITGENPSWNKPRAGGAGGQGGLLARAIARYKNVEVSAAKAYLDRLTDAQKQALRVDPRIATVINELRMESAAKPAGIDTDALLSGLGGDDQTDGDDDDPDDYVSEYDFDDSGSDAVA